MTNYVSEDTARAVKQLRKERELKKIEARRKIEELKDEKEFRRQCSTYED